jgi:hypothetical protein
MTSLHWLETKLLALPRQQAGQFRMPNESRSMLSTKQDDDSDEQVRVSPSHSSVWLTGADVGLVLASTASQERPLLSVNGCRSSLVAPPELQAKVKATSSNERVKGAEARVR